MSRYDVNGTLELQKLQQKLQRGSCYNAWPESLSNSVNNDKKCHLV